MANGETINFRVDRLEKQVDTLDEKIDKIMSNDLPHIQSAISSVKTEVRLLAAINIGALILVKFLL